MYGVALFMLMYYLPYYEIGNGDRLIFMALTFQLGIAITLTIFIISLIIVLIAAGKTKNIPYVPYVPYIVVSFSFVVSSLTFLGVA